MSQLLEQVEETRRLMVKHGLEYGLLDDKTIELSKKLDELLNLYSESNNQNTVRH